MRDLNGLPGARLDCHRFRATRNVGEDTVDFAGDRHGGVRQILTGLGIVDVETQQRALRQFLPRACARYLRRACRLMFQCACRFDRGCDRAVIGGDFDALAAGVRLGNVGRFFTDGRHRDIGYNNFLDEPLTVGRIVGQHDHQRQRCGNDSCRCQQRPPSWNLSPVSGEWPGNVEPDRFLFIVIQPKRVFLEMLLHTCCPPIPSASALALSSVSMVFILALARW